MEVCWLVMKPMFPLFMKYLLSLAAQAVVGGTAVAVVLVAFLIIQENLMLLAQPTQ
jgi:hypothetical protein